MDIKVNKFNEVVEVRTVKDYLIILGFFLVMVLVSIPSVANALNLNSNTTIINNTCVGQMNNMRVSVYPCTVETITGKDITQYVNFTRLGASLNTSWLFGYDGFLESGNIAYWNNNTITTHDYHDLSFVNVTTFTASGLTVQVGDGFSPVYVYNITQLLYANSSWINKSSIIGFDNYTNQGNGNYIIYWDNPKTSIIGWSDISNLINYLGVNLNLSIYSVRETVLNQGETIQTRWVYTPKDKVKSGKWHIFGKQASTSLNDAISSSNYFYIDPWWNTSWGYKMQLNVNGSEVDATLTNYPVLVRLNSTRVTMAKIKSDCSDLRFVNSAENALLPYEIENCTSTEIIAWVGVPSVATGSNTAFYLYYNNTNAVDGQNITGVWDSNYLAVYHMNGTVKDSTGKYDGTWVGDSSTALNCTSLTIGCGYRFNGSIFVKMSDMTYTVSTARTFEAFAEVDAVSAGGHRQGIDTVGAMGDSWFGLTHDVSDYPSYNVLTTAGHWDRAYVTNTEGIKGKSNFIAGTWANPNTLAFYQNITKYVVDSSGTGNLKTDGSEQAQHVTYGASCYGNNYWLGTLDEVRFSNINRSDAWLKAEGYNWKDNRFVIFGSEEAIVPTLASITQPTNTTYTDYLVSNLTINATSSQATIVCTKNVNGNVTVNTVNNNTSTVLGIVSQWGNNKINITCFGTGDSTNGTAEVYYTETETPPSITITHPTNTTYWNNLSSPSNLTYMVTSNYYSNILCTLDINNNVSVYTVGNGVWNTLSIINQWNSNKLNLTCFGDSGNGTETVYYTLTDVPPTVSISYPTNTTYWTTLPVVVNYTVLGNQSNYNCFVDVNGNKSVYNVNNNSVNTKPIISNLGLVVTPNKINISCTNSSNNLNGTDIEYYTVFSANITENNYITNQLDNFPYMYNLTFRINPEVVNSSLLYTNFTFDVNNYQVNNKTLFNSTTVIFNITHTAPAVNVTGWNITYIAKWNYNYTLPNNSLIIGDTGSLTITDYHLWFGSCSDLAIGLSNYCPDNWTWWGGNCYYVNTTLMNWTEANKSCVDVGAHFVTINSQAENNLVESLITSSDYYSRCTDPNCNGAYIGFYEVTPSSNDWAWAYPNTTTYTAWGAYQPDSIATQFYAYLESSGAWVTINPSTGNRSFVCEQTELATPQPPDLTPTLILFFYDEHNNTLMNQNVTLNAYFNYGNFNNTASFNDSNSYSICLYPPWLSNNLSSSMNYYSSNYLERWNYLINILLSNISIVNNLFLLDNGHATITTIRVLTPSGLPYSNALVRAMRQYIGGSYGNGTTTVSSCITDNNGYCSMPLEWSSAYYQFQVINYQTGQLIKTSVLTILGSSNANPLIINTNITSFSYLNRLNNIYYSNTTTNVSNMINFTFLLTDTSGEMTGLRLTCTNVAMSGNMVVSSSNLTGSSVTGTCVLGNVTDKLFIITATTLFPDGNDLVYTFTIDGTTHGVNGAIFDPVFITAFVVMEFALAGLISPVVSIIFMILGLLLISAINISLLSITSTVTIIISGVFVAWLLRDRG